MKERPILFSAPMVRAILEDRKTQTRRIVKPLPSWQVHSVCNPSGAADPWAVWFHYPETDRVGHLRECPHGKTGDQLWVRETWWQVPEPSLQQLRDGADTWPRRVAYAADGDDPGIVRGWGWKLKPSIFMPRWASRITLEITDVRVQRLQEISEEDAKAEGISVLPLQSEDDPSAWYQSAPGVHQDRSARGSFIQLWGSINGAGSWASNPWVWALTFRRTA